MQFFLVLVPLHELLHEGDCHFAVLKLGPAVLILDGWCVNGEMSPWPQALCQWEGGPGSPPRLWADMGLDAQVEVGME